MADPVRTASLQPSPPPPRAARSDATQVAQDFESVFLTRVVEEMLATSRGMFGDGPGEQMWRGVMARAVADGLAGDGGIGLAPSVERTIAAYGGAGGGARQ